MKIAFILLMFLSLNVFAQEAKVVQEKKTFSNLIVFSELRLQGITLTDLGLERSENFTRPVSAAVEKWMMPKIESFFEGIVSCEEDCPSFYYKWIKMLPEEAGPIEEKYRGHVFLRMELFLKKNLSDFEWSGRLIFIEINTKRVLKTLDIPATSKKWNLINKKELNSALASEIYKRIIYSLQKINDHFLNEHAYQKVLRLNVQGYKKLDDVRFLISEMESRMKEQNLIIKIDSFDQEGAQLLIYLPGEEKSFSDLLSRLKELKLFESYKIMHEFNGVQHVLKFVNE